VTLTWCVAVCCGVLQCVAVCCGVLRCVAVCSSVLQCVVHNTRASIKIVLKGKSGDPDLV